MGLKKKNSKQKNSRHHINTAPVVAKKQSSKAKLRNKALQSRLDQITGLAGAAKLFAQPKRPQTEATLIKQQKMETETVVEEDMLALMSMKLSSTNAH